ncbi:MAG: hypothetical protein M4579_000526 [Chaenotheca gracillima]|nr:MAG: hypothetical protein M4579_000526 [Chaenotheca gracillima]
MALVSYSDSESSDAEEIASPPASSKPTTTSSSKSAFQKVVDRSNPHKIRVSLPQNARETDENGADEPPAKRARTAGAGAFSGFSSMLPAPKKIGQLGMSGGLGSNKAGFARGASLKTGAAPGFSRDTPSQDTEAGDVGEGGSSMPRDFTTGGPDVGQALSPERGNQVQPPENGDFPRKSLSKSTMFKPLSVARKPQKPKKTISSSADKSPVPTQGLSPQQSAKPTKKVSLFSLGGEESVHGSSTTHQDHGVYEPMVYSPLQQEEAPGKASLAPEAYKDASHNPKAPPQSQDDDPNSLRSIANDLNLDPAAMRQLLGRKSKGSGADDLPSAIQIKNFNTDAEYASNEALRAAGETVQHNPVRSIAPGKHNLRQLVNAVSTQKDALEEEFAKGKRNKKEAGGRYGW